MFFKDRIVSLSGTDRIIDVGPGAFPFAGAHAYLELQFYDPEKARAHRSGFELPPESQSWTFYSGGEMPFADKAFDYSVCSHVMQMSEDVDSLAGELQRISKGGYVEFPHPLYDFLFDFESHRHFVSWTGEEILWLPKAAVGFDRFSKATEQLRGVFEQGHCDFISELREKFFVGFEWSGDLTTRRVGQFEDLFVGSTGIQVPKFSPRRRMSGLVRSEARAALRWFGI